MSNDEKWFVFWDVGPVWERDVGMVEFDTRDEAQSYITELRHKHADAEGGSDIKTRLIQGTEWYAT